MWVGVRPLPVSLTPCVIWGKSGLLFMGLSLHQYFKPSLHIWVTWKALKILPVPHVQTTASESVGKGPRHRYLPEVSMWFSTRWSQTSLLTWKSSAPMKSFIFSFLTAKGDLKALEKMRFRGTMHCQDLPLHCGSVFVKTVTFFSDWFMWQLESGPQNRLFLPSVLLT